MTEDTYIPISELKDRRLYRVKGRNFQLAIWCGEKQDFSGIREKFGERFVDYENHWDAKEFATCKPLEDLGVDAPSEMLEPTQLFVWLDDMAKKFH